MAIYPVVSPDKLCKAANDPLPGQVNEPIPPINITRDNEWEVKEILASRLIGGR
jgi:hypothetical protein